MRVLKKISVFLMFLTSSVISISAGDHLTISKDIIFEVEVGTAIDLDLDPVDINFGNIVRNSNDTVTKTSYLKFKTAFTEDNKVKTYFPEGDLTPSDLNYAKFELEYQNKANETYTDKLPVYLQRINDMLVRKGEIQIPITAEIRGVDKNQRLGEYKKNIKMNVVTTPVNPTKALRTSGQGGMK